MLRSSTFVALSVLTAWRCDAATCNTQNGVVIGVGHDLQNTKEDSSDVCCTLCQANPNCLAWTFHVSGGQQGACWLHSSTSGRKSDATAVSGVPSGPFPPPPAWDACTTAGSDTLPFCDVSLSTDARIRDLVQRVSTQEAGAQLTARESPAIETLGLPSYYWGTNAIHGLQNVECLTNGQCPTAFPAPCALSATFNMSAVHDLGFVLGEEERAYYHAHVHNSLDTWSPTINIARDPRWGRNVESPGEDPLLNGRYGAAYTQGLQGYDAKVRKATVTIKHWVAYSLESYDGHTRHNYDAQVSAYDLASTYFPGWETVVKEGGARGVMCSYNMLNGKPTCGNPDLVDVLRKDWGFKGYVTSDTDSCADIFNSHKYAPSIEMAVKDCLEGGTDIDSGSTYSAHLDDAVSAGIVNRSFVDQALYNAYKMRFEMGMFDPNVSNPYRSITTDVVGSQKHQDMSIRATRQAMVLLKNDNAVLPLAKGIKLALLGQAIADVALLTGNYNGPLCAGGGTACWASLTDKMIEANEGGEIYNVTGTDIGAATAAANKADVIVLVLDNAKDGGGEGGDRHTISLSTAQQALADAMFAVKKPIIVVLVNGGIIGIDDIKDSAQAILEAFMPGVHGPQVIAETLFGDNNPGGKMPVTMYHSDIVNQMNFTSMDMNDGPGRSYRYFTGTPLYPFGYGLSYTTFDLKWSPEPPPTILRTAEGTVTYSVIVTNTGDRTGDEVVLAFMKPVSVPALHGVPEEKKRLFDFQRISLSPGSSTTLNFIADAAKDLSVVDADGHRWVHSGEFEIVFSRGHGQELSAPLEIKLAAPSLLRRFRRWW